MKRSLLFGLTGFVLVAGALALRALPSARSEAPSPTKMPLFPTRELEELDRVVQARFAVVPTDGSFGWNRVASPDGYHGSFHPISKREHAAVDALKKSRQQVAFFLAGRKKFPGTSDANGRVYGAMIFPPQAPTAAEVKKGQAPYMAVIAAAPQKSKLCALADAVFSGSKPDGSQQKQQGGWKIIACPIPASSPQCVTCHNNMARAAVKQPGSLPPIAKPDLVSLHDPLGVALYCYRTAPKIGAQQQIQSHP